MLAYYGPEWESLASRMVGRWCPSFSGATGLQLPDTTGRNHGSLVGFANNASDAYVFQALNFNGIDNNVIVPVRTPALTQLTLSVWARLRTTGGNGTGFSRLFSRSNVSEFAMSYQSSGLAVALNGTTNVFSYTNPGTRFDHICATWTGSTVRVFVNGVSIGSASFSGTIAASTTSIYLGSASVVQRVVDGLCDDFMILNTALTANEAELIYEQGRGGGMLREPPKRRSFFVPTLPFPVRRRSSRFLAFPG